MPVPFAGTLKVVASGDREIVMTGEFDAPRALVFDGFTQPDLVKQWLLVITTEFVETKAGTSVTMTLLFQSGEARDGVLKSGMEGGVVAGYERLAAILGGPPAG